MVLDEYATKVVGKFGMVWGVAVSAYYWVLEDQPALPRVGGVD